MKVTKLACDFCSKSQDEVAKLIVGPKDVCICNECALLCVGIAWGGAGTAALSKLPLTPASPKAVAHV